MNQPSAANRRAVSRPMPEAAPVMKIDLRPLAAAMCVLPEIRTSVYGPRRLRESRQNEETAMSYEAIRYERSGHRATVTLNRPQARNGITQEMLDELDDALKQASADEDLRVLELRGEGPDFCPGA